MSAPFDLSVETLDAWCDKLLGCTPLTENEVMQLCMKVRDRYAETPTRMRQRLSLLLVRRPRKCW